MQELHEHGPKKPYLNFLKRLHESPLTKDLAGKISCVPIPDNEQDMIGLVNDIFICKDCSSAQKRINKRKEDIPFMKCLVSALVLRSNGDVKPNSKSSP